MTTARTSRRPLTVPALLPATGWAQQGAEGSASASSASAGGSAMSQRAANSFSQLPITGSSAFGDRTPTGSHHASLPVGSRVGSDTTNHVGSRLGGGASYIPPDNVGSDRRDLVEARIAAFNKR